MFSQLLAHNHHPHEMTPSHRTMENYSIFSQRAFSSWPPLLSAAISLLHSGDVLYFEHMIFHQQHFLILVVHSFPAQLWETQICAPLKSVSAHLKQKKENNEGQKVEYYVAANFLAPSQKAFSGFRKLLSCWLLAAESKLSCSLMYFEIFIKWDNTRSGTNHKYQVIWKK